MGGHNAIITRKVSPLDSSGLMMRPLPTGTVHEPHDELNDDHGTTDTQEKRPSQRAKTLWERRIKRMFLPLNVNRRDIESREITLADLRNTIHRQSIPKSLCIMKKSPAMEMRDDCEDCRALYAYARLMRKPVSFLREVDPHSHKHDSCSISLHDPEANAHQMQAPEPTPEDEAIHDQLRKATALILTPLQEDIIYCRFVKDMTLQATGDRHGFTRERVRQLQEAALKRLKQYLEAPRILGNFFGTADHKMFREHLQEPRIPGNVSRKTDNGDRSRKRRRKKVAKHRHKV